MDTDGVNERYLKVGYRRRKEDDGKTSPEGRPVMGRKGIGKLSLFSIAEQVDVFTRTKETEAIGLKISTTALRMAMDHQDKEYHPDSIDELPAEINLGRHGTCIVASNLKNRIKEVQPDSLRRRLARRFSIIGKNDSGTEGSDDFSRGFRVFVNEEEVTSADREDLKFVEYLWIVGEKQESIERSKGPHFKQEFELDDFSNHLKRGEKLSGWIGTVNKPKSLTTNEGNLNSIIILARGRLVDEDILHRIAGAEVYTKYITGQIEADFLDDDDGEDIVTSNRQRLIEDDPRFERLIDYLRNCIRKIASQWSETRTQDKTTELKGVYPKVGEWIDSLPQGWRDKAYKLLQKIAALEIEDDESCENRKMLLRHSIFGFERLRLRGNAEELERALDTGVEDLLRLLSGKNDLEAALYFDIVSNRLDIINNLFLLVDENKKERVLQEYLFDHMWLLDPSWERATGDDYMEKQLKLRPEFSNDEDTKEKYGRVDIGYRTVSGKHVIIELKRASVKKTIYELAEQGAKYVDALKDLLPQEERDASNVEVVFIVGTYNLGDSHRIKQTLEGISPGSQIKTYEQLIHSAGAAYDEYAMKAKEVDKLSAMFEP